MIWKLPTLALFAFLTAMLIRYGITHAEDAPEFATGRVLEVIDGDTARIDVTVWLDQHVIVSVRLRAVDAPERHSKCAAERWAALQATEALKELIADKDVLLKEISTDKYGRALASIDVDGRDVATELLKQKVVRPYDGGTREGWC